MMNSNLNLSALPECKFAYQMVNSALLIPCAEYQRVLHFYVTEQLEISQGGHLLCRHGAAYRLGTGRETPCGSSAEQHWKPSFAYIDRCNCYHPDGKKEKPAHPCAGGFQPSF